MNKNKLFPQKKNHLKQCYQRKGSSTVTCIHFIWNDLFLQKSQVTAICWLETKLDSSNTIYLWHENIRAFLHRLVLDRECLAPSKYNLARHRTW